MKTTFLALFFLVPLAALGAAYHAPLVDTNGGFLTPSKATFLRQNVLNQQGITRQVDFVTDLNAATSPYRSGEHVLVIDAAPFGSGGPVLFFHDSGSSDPTNTVDTFICTAGGRWKAKRLYSGAIGGTLTVAGDTGNPVSNLVNSATATFVRTNGDVAVEVSSAIPRLASSNAFTALQYFQEGIHVDPNKPVTIGGVARTNWPTSGTGGSITVAGDTGNPVSNLVNSATTSFARTNGDVAVEITQVPATTISGTIDILRLPSEVATDSEVAATVGALTNGTGTLSVSNMTITGTLSAGSLSVPDDAYGAGWDGDTSAPTKNALYDKIETLGTGGSYDPWGNGSFDIVDELMGATATYANNGISVVNNAGAFASDTVEQGRMAIVRCRLDAQADAPTIGFHKAANIFRFPASGSGEMFLFSVVLKTSSQPSGGSVGDWIATAALQTYATATNFPPTDFVGFVHCTNLLGAMNWGFQCVSNSTGPGIIDTGVAVTNASWYELTVSVSETNAIGWINGVAVATNAVASTGIPIGQPGCAISRLIRTSTSASSADYYYDRFRFKYHKP